MKTSAPILITSVCFIMLASLIILADDRPFEKTQQPDPQQIEISETQNLVKATVVKGGIYPIVELAEVVIES